jgi:hypothetical protein
VGGNEYVIEKRIDALIIDGVSIEDSIIQIGDMDYGFGINGIIGGDLLIRTINDHRLRKTCDISSLGVEET